MTAAEALVLAQALIAGLKTIIPTIRDAVGGGEITPEQEQALQNDIAALRGQPGAQYTGPEWEQSGRTAQNPTGQPPTLPAQAPRPGQPSGGNPPRR